MTLTFTSNHPYTHTTGSSKQWPHCGSCVFKYFSHSVKFFFVSPLIYRTGAFIRLLGHKAQSTVMHSVWVFFFFFTCGMMLLETKWILFYVSSVAVSLALGLPEAWFSTARLRPGHKVHFSLSAAPDLLTHFLTQEIELTPRPGPRGPTAAYTAVH